MFKIECCGRGATQVEITKFGQLPRYYYQCEECCKVGATADTPREAGVAFTSGGGGGRGGSGSEEVNGGGARCKVGLKCTPEQAESFLLLELRRIYRTATESSLKALVPVVMRCVKELEGRVSWK